MQIPGLVPTLQINPGGSTTQYEVNAAAVIKAAPGTLFSIAIQAAGSAGSLTVNDTTTIDGASAANQILSLTYTQIAAFLTAGQPVIRFTWPCATGITISVVPTAGVFAVAFS